VEIFHINKEQKPSWLGVVAKSIIACDIFSTSPYFYFRFAFARYNHTQ
jgi:hypothetical protein